MKPLEFFQPCDRYRMNFESGEENWHEMMGNKKEIPVESFLKIADTSRLLDDDETVEDFMASDPEAATYISTIKDEKVAFIATSGFEFIFTKDGEEPGKSMDKTPDTSLPSLEM